MIWEIVKNKHVRCGRKQKIVHKVILKVLAFFIVPNECGFGKYHGRGKTSQTALYTLGAVYPEKFQD